MATTWVNFLKKFPWLVNPVKKKKKKKKNKKKKKGCRTFRRSPKNLILGKLGKRDQSRS